MKSLAIDEDTFREWLLLYFDRMREMETEVLVYRGTIEILRKEVPPEMCEVIDKLAVNIRKLPETKQILDKRYNRYRAQVLEAIAKGSQNRALSQYLQEWKAKGPIN